MFTDFNKNLRNYLSKLQSDRKKKANLPDKVNGVSDAVPIWQKTGAITA